MRIRLAQREQSEEQQNDPAIVLFVAIVRQAQRDLAIPSDSKSSHSPTTFERETAQQFLQELFESATRRTP